MQEKVFCHVFHAAEEDVGNTAFDVSLRLNVNGEERKYLVGIKTFLFDSGAQKIAQMKSAVSNWQEISSRIKEKAKGLSTSSDINSACADEYLELALSVSAIRNSRIDSSVAQLKGFIVKEDDTVESVYHVLLSAVEEGKPTIYVGETDYDRIDIQNLKVLGCTDAKHVTNINFTDGKHFYRFTSADSQLLMDFNNRNILLEAWPVVYIPDPFSALKRLAGVASEGMQATTGVLDQAVENVPHIIESYSWLLTDKGEVPRYSGFNMFYGVGSKLGQNQRTALKGRLENEYLSIMPDQTMKDIIDGIVRYISWKTTDGEDRAEKEKLRNEIMSKATGKYSVIKEDARKVLYRPMSELYIPIPDSRNFHKAHPNFFAPGAGMFVEGTAKLKLSKEERSFSLMFEPSGNCIRSFITQDFGKAIESCEKQTYLGDWILHSVFRLKEGEPLTKRTLDELGINGIRLYRTDADDHVHIEFVWIDMDNPPSDLIVRT